MSPPDHQISGLTRLASSVISGSILLSEYFLQNNSSRYVDSSFVCRFLKPSAKAVSFVFVPQRTRFVKRVGHSKMDFWVSTGKSVLQLLNDIPFWSNIQGVPSIGIGGVEVCKSILGLGSEPNIPAKVVSKWDLATKFSLHLLTWLQKKTPSLRSSMDRKSPTSFEEQNHERSQTGQQFWREKIV